MERSFNSGWESARGVLQAGHRPGPEKWVRQSRQIDGESMEGRIAEVREGWERV
jgi:hypothetical protein